MNPLSIVSYSEAINSQVLWDDLALRCDDSWFWNCFSYLDFNLSAGEKLEVKNLSFFLFIGEKAVGLAPLTVQKNQVAGEIFWDAQFYSGPLPWPCFDIAELSKAGVSLEQAEDFAFDELERRAKSASAGRIWLQYSPSVPDFNRDQSRVSRVILERKYLDLRYTSHFIELKPDALKNARERFLRYCRKFSPSFDLKIYDSTSMTPELEEKYFQLHTLDAGGQYRSRKSYEKQMNLVRNGNALLFVAIHKEKKETAGMLLISLFKNAAYDNSVAIHPEYRDLYVAHLLKRQVIEDLIQRGVRSYELGIKPRLPLFGKIYSSKYRNISHFKEGWTGGATNTVFWAEKFLDKKRLKAQIDEQNKHLEEYFELNDHD